MSQLPKKNPVAVSIGLMVSNEEGTLPAALASLAPVRQSLFERRRRQPGRRKITTAPAALSGFVFALIACARASRALRTGLVFHGPGESRPVSAAIPAIGAKSM